MQLSIVVTSYDLQRRKDIIDLLDSIQAQVCNDFEVIYITERSRSLYDFVKNFSTAFKHRCVMILK